MRSIRRYEEGGMMGDPSDPKKDSKSAFIERARDLVDLKDFPVENLEGLDYDKMMNMSDDEMKGLLGMISTFKMPRDEEGKLKVFEFTQQLEERLPEIKKTLGGLTENYGLDTKPLLQSILDNSKDFEGEPLGWGAKKAAMGSAWGAGLYAGGGLMKLRKSGLY
jgi:hypothetical protein